MYLIDTDVIIWILRGDKEYENFLQELKNKGSLSVSTITIAEIYKNVYPSEMVMTENLLNELLARDVNTSTAKQAGLYWQQYVKKLKNLGLADCLIAATANVNDLTLVTLNVRHFPMKDIRVLNPKSKKKNN